MDEPAPPTFYASGVSFAISPWDITLIINGRSGPTPKDVNPIAQIVLSPQHALIVSRLLTRQVEAYVEQFGQINLPPRLFNDLGLEP